MNIVTNGKDSDTLKTGKNITIDRSVFKIKIKKSCYLLLLALGAMISPRSEQNKQKTAMTLLQPRQPNLSIKVEAIGANKNVPAPDPQTQIPRMK